MAGLKERLLALANGQTDLDAVVSSVEADARESLANAENILDELDEAYKDNQLDLESFAVLKKSVLTTITTLDAEDPGLDFDLTQESGEMADPDKTLVTNTSQASRMDQPTMVTDPSQPTQSSAVTAVPGAEHTGPVDVGPGTLLRGRFYIDEVLGKGGMGTVYKGRDALKLEAKDRNPHVAVKVLNEDIKQRSDAFIALQREASRQQRLAHPNIATVYDFDRVGGLIFITMELLEGTPLDEYMKEEVRPNGGIPFEQALPLIKSLASALDYAHNNNIIHSDFKPSNCFLTKDNDIKILDFGIARAVRSPEQQEQTLFDGSKLGAMTPSYASFEMLESVGDPHPGDDVYALACVSYELLTGKHPFNRLPANVASENNLEPAPIQGLSRAQNRALARGLAFHRENRAPSAESFIEALSGGSGAPASKVWRFAAIGGVVFVVGVGAIFGMSQYQQRQLDAIAEGLASDDRDTVIASLAKVDALQSSDRQQILNVPAAKNRLTSYFEGEINSKLENLDFAGIESTLALARTYYGDSARIENAAQNAVEQKNRLLAELSETYESSLSSKKLLPTGEGDDMPGIIEKLRKIDPENSLITDSRLASTYAQEADRLVSEYEFDQAKQVIDVGQTLAANHPALVNVQDRLDKERTVADQKARAQELEIKLAPDVAGSRTLESFVDIGTDLKTLAAIAPDSPVINKARENLEPAVKEKLAALKATPNVEESAALDENFGALLAAIGLTALSEQVAEQNTSAAGQVDNLANGIADAIALGNLDGGAKSATGLLASLRSIAPDDPRGGELQNQLIRAYLSRASDNKLAGAWDEARNQIAMAQSLNPSDSLADSLSKELASIDETEKQAAARLEAEGREKAERERAARIAGLEKEVQDDTAAAKNLADARKVLRKVSSLQSIAPDSPQIKQAQTALADKLAAAALTKGESGDWSGALTDIKKVASLFPESSAVTSAAAGIEKGRDEAQAAAQQAKIDKVKSDLEGLVSGKPDSAWSKKTTALLSDATNLLSKDEPWITDMRNQLTDVYLAEAARLESSQRFTLAGQQLDRAQKINPTSKDIKSARDELKVALAEFRNEQREKDTAARIEAHKQTFMAHIKSKQVANARKTLALLRKDLPGEDPFIKTEAPKLIAGVYLDFAKSKLDQKAFADAKKFAESGLEYAPKSGDLQAALSDAKKGLAAAAAKPKPPPPVAKAPEPKPEPPKAVAPPPAPPVATTITQDQVFGDWCSDSVKLTLAASSFTFHLPGGNQVRYAVSDYDFAEKTFTVKWSDKKVGNMETEFGELAADKNSLTQIRGRSVKDSKWNNYNRRFKRCN